MAFWHGDWIRRLAALHPQSGPLGLSRSARRWMVGVVAALAFGAAVDTATAHNPTWVAAAINTAHAVGLTPYRAVPFRQVRLLPYTAVTVDDPNLPVGLHQVRQPGLTGSMLTTGIALYRGPTPAATPVPARTPRSVTAPTPTSASSPSGTGPAAPRASAATRSSASATVAPPPTTVTAGPALAPSEVKVLSSTVLSQPRQAVIVVGTSSACVPVNGRCYHFSRVLDMAATAYDSTWASNGRWTGQRSAIGLPLDYGIVAVDPSVIPLGSRLYVEHYGLAIAADTGSAIVGNRIDLFFWDTPRDIAAFGIQHLKVYVLDDSRLKPAAVPAVVKRTLG